MSNNVDSKLEKFDLKYWRRVEVSIDKILEIPISELQFRFKSMLNSCSLFELEEIGDLLGVDLNETKKKGEKIECFKFISADVLREIIILREFLSRKKKTVTRYYNSVAVEYDKLYRNSSICQLYQMMKDNSDHINEIYTWYHWDSKGTGKQFLLNKIVTFEKCKKIPTEFKKDFVDFMHSNSNKESYYDVFSYAMDGENRLVVMLYRQISDVIRPDFDEPFRNKEVAPIMFQIDISNNILEIRSKFQREKISIKKYLEKTFATNLTEIEPELFTKYQPEKLKEAILEGITPNGHEVQDFIINKIVFRSSPLINSPSLIFQLNNGDVLPSVKDAHTRECVDLESIKDIESLAFKTSKVSRTIRSTVFDDGNIMFSIDDSGLESEVKKDIEDKFLMKFGIPLNKLISNSKFVAGKADLTDYLMTLSFKKDFPSIEEDLFNKLIQDKIVVEELEQNVTCKNPECDYSEDTSITFTLSECPSCGNTQLKVSQYDSLNISLDTIRAYVKKLATSFCEKTEWELNKDTEKKYNKNKYKFINLDNKQTNESLQILVQQGAISNSVLEKINRTLTPTVIVFVGVLEKYLDKYNNNCIFPISFGSVYNMQEPKDFFGQIYESIKHRTKSYLSSVASKSFDILVNLPEPESIGDKYSPGDFEDDVFNIIKDIFPNAEKWGKKMSGKEVPEGIFALTYTVQGAEEQKKQYVFSYDCKLNKTSDGYDLGKSEQRKAYDYVEMLNQINYITKFSNTKQLSAHIFISNNFNTNNYETMADYFYKKLPENNHTRPIFLPIEVLTFLHSEYRKHYQQLNNSRNIFMEELFKVLITDKLVISTEDIKEVMEQALDKDLADYSELDTVKVTKDIDKKLKKRG
ncbi:hypothetical protein FJQ98_14005 [Lysinibacillus agricola]|uniref:Uncharacterized protein n=1 Tax=Lysinibacillus agricola TaxID=2590012 RepID=A0ABX7ALU1_9BACI|nr:MULTISPECIES: hypothetical protein [Lysinibacillus]KOS64611.1 hypothetical protein AN161_00870 [Lysinibacillus sp. FJAT-14222]QQP10402.1 hypothetical protein FJQ98_14005 [Lysinibacillus agricola]